ncbi:MAG: phage protein Gp27 family protein [Alishewanella aestuarii]
MKGTKVDLLPDDIRAKLHQLIDSKRYTSQQIADMVNRELEHYAGTTDVESISKNLVWREAKKLEEVAEDMRRSQSYAKAMSDKLDLNSLGEQGVLLQSMLMSAMFKTTAHAMASATEDSPIDPETLGDLVLSIQRLQRTANFSAVLEKQIEERTMLKAKAAAAEAAVTAAKKAGVGSGNVELIRAAIAGARL